MVLAQAERRLALAEKLAAVIADPRDPLRLVHRLSQILRARILAIACGYDDFERFGFAQAGLWNHSRQENASSAAGCRFFSATDNSRPCALI